MILLRSADFSGAGNHFRRAVDLGIAGAGYYLGLISWYMGDIDAAEMQYRSVPSDDPLWEVAQPGLAGVALLCKDWKRAIDVLRMVVAENDDQPSLTSLLALAHRCAGQSNEASQIFKQVLSQDPLNLMVLRELSILDVEHGDRHEFMLQRLLADDQQYNLDLAAHYMDIGLPADALSLLDRTVEEWAYPMAFYLGAYIYQHLGIQDRADQWIEKAQQSHGDRGFPAGCGKLSPLSTS